MREHVVQLASHAGALLLLGDAAPLGELCASLRPVLAAARIPSPIAKQSARPSVVRATRNGCHVIPIAPAATIVASQALPTEMRAQRRAPRTTAPTMAKARATKGGPASGATNRSRAVSAATTATVGPGNRRAARRARADAAASARLADAAAGGVRVHAAIATVPPTWIRKARATGRYSVSPGGGRNRGSLSIA
ncbi:hypothetical protein [Microbacterium aoyamense]|nr:hypothetical protein [Microbacterium aoyamense]